MPMISGLWSKGSLEHVYDIMTMVKNDHKNMLMISGLWSRGSQEHAYDIRTMDKMVTRTCL